MSYFTKPPEEANPDQKEAQADAKPVTNRVLKLVRGGGQPEESQAHFQHAQHHSEEEDKAEVDERWLMAYADKMTLLCGCFILLFALSTMDKVKYQKVKESAEKSFGKPNTDTKQDYVELEKMQEVQKQKEQLETQVKQLQTAVKEARSQSQSSVAVQVQLEENKRKVVEEQAKQKILEQKIVELAKVNQTLREQVKQQEEIPEPEPKPVVKVEDTKAIKAQLVQAEKQIQNLKQQMVQMETNLPKGAFMALVINWPTVDHDIDLQVTDPQGTKFDFKQRKHANHPGMFVLDTRRGPGAEIWQSDRIIPGVYKFKYQFYNSYGNKNPCPVTGTLFTPKGSLELPKTTLTTENKREVTFNVSIDGTGKADLQR